MQKKTNRSFFISQGGMTLIEVLIITSLVLILNTIVLLNYRTSQAQFALQRSANRLAQDIRRAKYLAMSAVEYPPGSGTVPETGYGIVFNTSWNIRKYRLYADTAGNNEFYTPADGVVEDIDLEKGIYIEKMILPPAANRPKISINFKPPDPETKIKYLEGDNEQEVRIILAAEADPTKTKTIKVNKLGLVTFE